MNLKYKTTLTPNLKPFDKKDNISITQDKKASILAFKLLRQTYLSDSQRNLIYDLDFISKINLINKQIEFIESFDFNELENINIKLNIFTGGAGGNP